MKSIKGLASQIAKREGKKSQARIGDIREILGIISDIYWASMTPGDISQMFITNGEKRKKKSK